MSIEVEERQPVINATHHAQTFARYGFWLSIVTAIIIATLAVLRREEDNTAIIATIIGLMTPVILALINAAVRGIGIGIDGQMNRLFAAVSEKERNAGYIDGAKDAKKGEI